MDKTEDHCFQVPKQHQLSDSLKDYKSFNVDWCAVCPRAHVSGLRMTANYNNIMTTVTKIPS